MPEDEPSPPIYREVMRDLGINPFTPLERYRAWNAMLLVALDIVDITFVNKQWPWQVPDHIIRSEN